MTGTSEGRRLIALHAHPDDEVLFTGGILARYTAEGAQVTLVCCTGGEEGEIADLPQFGDKKSTFERLGAIRAEELKESCALLGVSDVRMLGYRDSGMAATAPNSHPDAFVNADPSEAARSVARILLEVRPHVAVTYDHTGFYGHPDHVRAHEIMLAGVELAAQAGWAVPRVCYLAGPVSWLKRWRNAAAAVGVEDGWLSEEIIAEYGTPDDQIGAIVDVSGFTARKLAALEAHRTQLGTTQRFLSIPRPALDDLIGTEYFVLASEKVDAPLTDLFSGVA